MAEPEVHFEADIRGHRPPYQWRLFRRRTDASGRVVVKVNRGDVQCEVSGEADTFEAACFDAQAAAEDAYDSFLQEHVKETVVVLRGPVVVPREGDSDMPVIEPNRELQGIDLDEEDEVKSHKPVKPLNPAPALNPRDFMD